MEIELRAKIDNSRTLRDTLDTQAKFVRESREDDLYLKHEKDLERVLILRIRRSDKGSQLTFKSKARGHDTAWPDVDINLENPDDLEKILLSSGYVEVVRIIKSRATYLWEDFEINIDEIQNLGSFVEIEGRGNEEERTNIEKSLLEIFEKLSVSSSQIVHKGYVPLMLEKLGQ